MSDGVLHLTAPVTKGGTQLLNKWKLFQEQIPERRQRRECEVYPAPFTSGAINTFNDKVKVKASFKGDLC